MASQSQSQSQGDGPSQSQNQAATHARLLENKALRLEMRTKYREHLNDLEERREELEHASTSELHKQLQLQQSIFTSARGQCTAREAVLDSESLLAIVACGEQAVQRLQVSITTFDVSGFLAHLSERYGRNAGARSSTSTSASTSTSTSSSSRRRSAGGAVEDEEDDDATAVVSAAASRHRTLRPLDWRRLGLDAVKFTRAIPRTEFMYGPIAITAAGPRHRTVHQRSVVAPRRRAEEGVSTDEGDETKQRVSEVADLLHKQSPIELYRFLINPRDFGQTIENWFHFSFLIKDGRAKVSVGPGGVLVAEHAEPPKASDFDQGRASRKQTIVVLDYKQWQNAIAMLGITEPVIPHRDYSRYAAEPLVGSKRASASQPTATTTTTSSSSSSSSTSRSRATASSSSSSQGNGRSRSSQHTDTDDESDQEEDAAVAQPSKRQRLMSAAR